MSYARGYRDVILECVLTHETRIENTPGSVPVKRCTQSAGTYGVQKLVSEPVYKMVLCLDTSEVSGMAMSDLVPMGRWQCQQSSFWDGSYEELGLKHPVSDSAHEEMAHHSTTSAL